MTKDRLREALSARPFVPFLLHLPDGRSARVPHPEFVSYDPESKERAIHVWRAGFVDLLRVSDIEFVPTRRRRTSA